MASMRCTTCGRTFETVDAAAEKLFIEHDCAMSDDELKQLLWATRGANALFPAIQQWLPEDVSEAEVKVVITKALQECPL